MLDDTDDLDTADERSTSSKRKGAEKDADLLKRLKRWERQAKRHWSAWRVEAKMCFDFVAGHQWSSDDKAKLLDEMRQPVTFNRIGPMVDAVTGAEILNRQEVRYSPREQGDVQVNELITAADEWSRDLANTEDHESDAFADVVVCGLAWTETRMEYAEDPEGRIVDERVDPFEMWPDPKASQRCLSDRRYQIRGRWRERDDLPKAWLKKLPDVTGGGPGSADDMAHGYSSPRDDYDHDDAKAMDSEDRDKNRVWITHFQWFDKEERYRVEDPDGGEAIVLERKDYAKIAKQFLQAGMKPPPGVKFEMNVYYEAFVAGNALLESGPLEAKKFTFNCITGKRDRNANTFFGVVRAMIDPQMWGNKFFVQIMHILNTSARGGLLYEQGAFTNPQKALDAWAKPDEPIELESGALSGPKPKVQEREQRVFPAGTDKMMEFALNNLPQTSGINLELLGLVERDQPGVLEMQRKKAGYAILAVFFDSLRLYRKIKGTLRLYFIQNFISDGRLIRIKGKGSKTAQYAPLVADPNTVTYDVVVDEAPMSPNQKEQTWQMVMGLMPMLAKLNVPPEVWQVLLEYSPLPSDVSGEINEIITKQAQQPPPPDPEMEKIKAQMQIAQQEAQIDAQTKMQDAQLEQQKMQAELIMKREEHALEMQKMQAEIQALREKTMLQMQGEQAKLAMQGEQHALQLEYDRDNHRQTLEQTRQMGDAKVEQTKALAKAKPKAKQKAAA